MKTVFVLSVLPAACALSLSAATLTSVQMGGAMIHANVLYDSAGNRLVVHVEPTVPQLTPLDVINPADNYDPLDPWFACLDPSSQGMACNRQYGFVMDAGTDPLPAYMGIWMRHLSHSPGLEFYRYRSSAQGKSWEPIFGSAGSTNVFEWTLLMFHPAICAVPTQGTATATFEAFAVDSASGLPLASIAPAVFSLNWTIVASARPTLELSAAGVLSWPGTATNYVLESATSPAGDWAGVPETPLLKEGRYTLEVGPIAERQFYRLRRNP